MSDQRLHPNKITAEHVRRRAIVYVRQSSDHQVRHNLESQRLQYALVDRARALGWQQVDVIDADLGISAGAGTVRAGFDQVLAAVARGEVGIILAREVSRLSRNDKDFCRLVELCQVFGALLGDAEQVYDPAQMDDQLVLGIKGTLSVVELRVLRMRLVQGMRNKASRGEMHHLLPPGFVVGTDGKVVLDPDERVRQAVAYVFDVFRQTGSARQTMLRLHHEGTQLPVHRRSGQREQLVWQLPRSSYIGAMLHNPYYAGAYAWGRRPVEHRYEDGRLQRRQGRALPLDQCPVLLWDHHPGYISRAQFEEHQRMLQANDGFKGKGPAVRTGRALLTGLLRCGRCGRRLHVKYWMAAGSPGRYLCDGTHTSGGRYCLGLPGGCMDDAVSGELLRVLTPLGMQASLAALERAGDAQDGRRKALTLQVEQLQYQVRIAQERYEQVDARNRLVASELERRWNEKLGELAGAQARLVELGPAQSAGGEQERQAIHWLGAHFASVWHSQHCPVELKKRILRALVQEIVVDATDSRISMILHWQGGRHTRLETGRPNRKTAQANAPEDVDVIRQLAPRYSDEQIGRVLGRMGRLTGKGKTWNAQAVKSARNKHGIAGGDIPKSDPEILSMNGAARHAGVSDTTLRRLVDAGLLANTQRIPWAPWEIRRRELDAEPVAGILEHLRKTGRLVLRPIRPDGVPEQLALFQGGNKDG
jgi:DNA invertase Pin-like site-specific DNA recombinase